MRNELELSRRGMEHGVGLGSLAAQDGVHGGKDGSSRAASAHAAASDGQARESDILSFEREACWAVQA